MRARLRAFPWWGWTLTAVAVVVGLVAAIGGFGETPITKVPTIALGDTYQGRQVDSSVESVELMSELPNSVIPEAGNQLVVATARLVNHDDAPAFVGSLELMLLIDEIDYVEVSKLQFSARDLGGVSSLQPGVPTGVLYIWEVPSSITADQVAIIGLLEAVPDEDNLLGDGNLGEPVAVRRIDVTLDRAPSRSEAGS